MFLILGFVYELGHLVQPFAHLLLRKLQEMWRKKKRTASFFLEMTVGLQPLMQMLLPSAGIVQVENMAPFNGSGKLVRPTSSAAPVNTCGTSPCRYHFDNV